MQTIMKDYYVESITRHNWCKSMGKNHHPFLLFPTHFWIILETMKYGDFFLLGGNG